MARDDVVARLDPVTTRAGINVVGYRVIVTHKTPLCVFSADLPASANG